MPSRPTRVSRRRSNKKWSPVLIQESVSYSLGGTSVKLSSVPLCTNSNNTSLAPTATIIKAGNFKVVVDVNISDSFTGSGRMYVMFVPQGYDLANATSAFPGQHPEWIMCWRGFEPGHNGLQAVSMQSKLKRNLNSGDQIVLVIVANNLSGVASTVSLTVSCSYVCCANYNDSFF
ncbi:putative capsid protein [Odonata-associated circular virus-14]|uniref:Putative capsid protein n=1 Tax=Odonata-associated circular virus-14 TaxID=1592114 RepID=A0A0B4UH46_9VIRU|nr:putative capsid protein [Odonata-associated circular virus-14]AJD07484.1 putative capsid protein [Odonata-associated circular virus-14]